MDIFEVKQKETLWREEVAERLRTLADMLARHKGDRVRIGVG